LSRDGEVVGLGDDDVGAFTISGKYAMPQTVKKAGMFSFKKLVSVPGKISFDKAYIGAHTVQYEGLLTLVNGTDLEAKGSWTIPGVGSNMFRMTMSTSASAKPDKPPPGVVTDRFLVAFACSRESIALIERISSELAKQGIICVNNGDEPVATILSKVQQADALVAVLDTAFETNSDCRKVLAFADKVGRPIVPVHSSSTYTQDQEVAVICAGLLYTIIDPNEGDLNKCIGELATQIKNVCTSPVTKMDDQSTLIDSRSVRGWYEQYGNRYLVTFNSLNMSGGRLSGQGLDSIGEFIIAGSYDGPQTCRVAFDKQYLGKHSVHYGCTLAESASTGRGSLIHTRVPLKSRQRTLQSTCLR